MDSYNFHFERMSNVDLHTLSLPVSRLSPAKSNSSIVDQFAHHHQHGKGDSAYSSFSGGSTAPDYPSPLLPDDLQSSSFNHFADLKHVKSIYPHTHVLHSDSKTMDQLYRSVEAISQQYRNNTSTNVNHHNSNDSFHNNNKVQSDKEMALGAPPQSSQSPPHPPPVPTRLDSFITTKNLENTRVHNHSTEFKPQQPLPQQQLRPYNRRHLQQHSLTSQSQEKANPDTCNSSFSSEPLYSVWRGSQHQQPQAQQPPGYHLHLQSNEQSQILSNPGYLSIMDNKAASEHQKLKNTQSGSPPRGISHSECLIPRQVSTSGGCNEDQHSKYSSSFESQRKRAHSAHDWLGSETSQAATPSSIGQSFINSSIQHKGQFYFVTGVCKLSDAGIRSSSVSMCGSDAGSVSSTVLEKHHVREKERSHSTMENLFRPLHERPSTSSGTISDEREFFLSMSQGKDPSSRSHDQENHRPAFISMQSSQSFEDDVIQSREIGRHTANNPIFYCGPDKNGLPHSPTQNKEVTSLMNNDQPNHFKKEDHAKRGKRQPLGDVASEKINKETTPILYHLTEANRAVLQPKKDADISIKGNETVRNRIGHGDVLVNKNERPPKGDTSKNDQGDTISVACNTLDESFKKYYKEKLKDAQSKVLRETSFKRRDLQLSWPHRIRQKSDLRPTVIHSFSPSQDSETSTDTLPPSVTSEETEQWSIKEEVRENQMEMDIETEGKENGRPANVAQPQVGRCGGRKRLTPEQKKMCYSEPEKLNHLGGTPSHSACRSFGNESDNVFVAESEHQGEQGLVAARRKMFETRGRALSASSTSKTNLKHLQHKALVEYMERKTGQKVAEPQTPAPQLPPPTRQRHSLGEKPFDWGPKTVSGNHEGKNIKKKLHRPQSAGRILDSSTSSIRYAQFFSEQTCSGPLSGKSNQPRWRESQGPQGKSASVENLLDQPDPPSFYRNRSTSTPHAFQGLQAHEYSRDPFPFNPVETCSSQKNTTDDSLANPVSEGKQYVRAVAQRGKSMEELGASKLVRQSALSKSSEQLDQRCRHSTGPGGSELDKRSFSFIAEVRDAQGLERERQKQDLTEKAEEEPEIVGQTSPQGRIQNQAQKMPPLKQNSEPGEDASESTRCTTRSTSPASCSSSWARVQFGPPESYDPVPDKFRPSNETSSNPPSPRGLDTSEREITPTSSSPAQPKLPCENRPCFSRVSASPSVAGSEREQSLDEPSNDTPTPDSDDEASLSCGITTDPSLCIPPPEEDIKEEVQNAAMTDRGSEDESSSSVSQTQTSDTSVFPCTFVSEAAVSHQRDEETNPESVDEKSEENQESEERGAPGGDKENLEEPNEKPQWEELVESVVNADQSLARVLYPLTNRKTALMLMEQLLSEDTLLMEEHYKKKQEQGGTAESTGTVKEVESSHCVSSSEAQDPALQSKTDIAEKKHLLVSCIKEHLNSLGEMRGTLQSEILENTAQGEALELLVQECCLPIELERYKLFIGDLERVVSLLLCLSARLARVQNALSTVDHDTDAEEKQSLDSRHRLLCKQREDAKDLKDNLDRRENLVSTFLSRQLSSVQLQDYRRFIQTKASLLIRQKDLEEKQRLGEEQLEALSNSLNL